MDGLAAVLEMERQRQARSRRLVKVAVLVLTVAMILGGVAQSPATADVSGITASAFGYYTNIGFNGEPLTVRGFGQTEPPGTLESRSPSVDCPTDGTSDPVVATDPDGALAQYGTRAIFSGQWPENATAPPPSGPLTVSCQGATGPTGSASSSAEVYNMGPGPFLADEVHSTCTATETGVTGTTTIIGGVLVTSTDADGKPLTTEAIPIEPDVNYTRTGTINDVGDTYRIVLNEQTEDPITGALTVNAVHLYFLGPTAEGEVVIGSSTCGVAVVAGTTTTMAPTTTTMAPTTTTMAPTTTTMAPTTTTIAPTTTTMAPTTTTTAPTQPSTKEDCKDGGWKTYQNPSFKNEAECKAFVKDKGK